jgi:hypothetical protein
MKAKKIAMLLLTAAVALSLFGCDSVTGTSSVSGSAGQDANSHIEGFSILGKWKSTGEEGVGQAQPGAIIAFSENECNLYSPQDTYALYEDGGTLRLDATGLLGGTLQCSVIVVDNDHIELRAGSIVTYLQRVG